MARNGARMNNKGGWVLSFIIPKCFYQRQLLLKYCLVFIYGQKERKSTTLTEWNLRIEDGRTSQKGMKIKKDIKSVLYPIPW